MSSTVTLYGAPYSVYVRIARLALLEKGIEYDLKPIDIFADSQETTDYKATLNPFGKIPTLRHGDLALYETRAIVRYVDEAFTGPALQPASATERARMEQVIGIVDSYAYPTLVWQCFVPDRRRQDGDPDAAQTIEAALPKARLCLAELDRLLGGHPHFGGSELSLADLYLTPVLGYFALVPEAGKMLAAHPDLSGWWNGMRERPAWRQISDGPENQRHTD